MSEPFMKCPGRGRLCGEAVTKGRRQLDCLSWVGGRLLGALCLLTTSVVGTAAQGWACIPQPLLWVEPRSSASSGAQVTVKGVTFKDAPIEIRWNGVDGPLLDRVTGPSFSATVSVPPAESGTYSIVAFARDQGGGVGASAQVAFTVAGGGGGTVAPETTSRPSPTRETSWRLSRGSGIALLLVSGLALSIIGGAVGALIGKRRHCYSSPPPAEP